jgi:mannosyltransferase
MLIPARTGAVSVARNDYRSWAARIPAEVWLVTGVTVVGAAVRFATLAHQSYWFDEAQAAHEFRLSFGAMLSKVSAYEPNPPLFFVLGWLWAHLFGTGEAGLRSLSALAGTAVIPIAYLCGRELVSRRAGLLAAALVALNPFMIWYSQEAREYMLLTALCGCSLLFFARSRREPSTRNLALWALFSGLALLTQYFAGFLVAVEAMILLYVLRSRAIVIATGALVLVEAALVPHLISHATHPRGWIDSVGPLLTRVEQVPVAFGLGALWQDPAFVGHGLLGAAVLVGCLIVLVVIGADSAELRGAGLAAAVAAFVLLAPIVLALVGHDYLEARALIPAWIPLAVVVGAACTARGARVAGAALAAVLLAAFVYAGVKTERNATYQRPNWRGVATALGRASTPRAIISYDSTFGTAPLAIYLPNVPWTGTGQVPQTSEAPVTVDEVDVVGSKYQSVPGTLPAGVKLVASRSVDDYRVARFSVSPSWDLSPREIGARAGLLLGPGPPDPGVLVQGR